MEHLQEQLTRVSVCFDTARESHSDYRMYTTTSLQREAGEKKEKSSIVSRFKLLLAIDLIIFLLVHVISVEFSICLFYF